MNQLGGMEPHKTQRRFLEDYGEEKGEEGERERRGRR